MSYTVYDIQLCDILPMIYSMWQIVCRIQHLVNSIYGTNVLSANWLNCIVNTYFVETTNPNALR